jgi:hypothetical protein
MCHTYIQRWLRLAYIATINAIPMDFGNRANSNDISRHWIIMYRRFILQPDLCDIIMITGPHISPHTQHRMDQTRYTTLCVIH